MEVVVIGGVAAGMSAAAKIRRLRSDANLTVYEKGGFFSYGACGLPYYIAGLEDDPGKLVARSREEFAQAGIETLPHHEVLAVDPPKKTVRVKNLETDIVFEKSYDKLMLATGAQAVRPNIPGLEKRGVYPLKTMEQGIALKAAAAGSDARRVVVLGGGNLGLELAEAMHAQGSEVTVLEGRGQVLPQFLPEIGAMAAEELEKNGVRVRTGERVIAFEGGESVSAVRTEAAVYPADIVVLAVGIRPDTSLLEGSGIALGKNVAVEVDRRMRTNMEDVYAAGDCAMVYHRLKGENVYFPQGTVANKCGRIAGANICGGEVEFPGTICSAALKVFGLELGRTGLSGDEAPGAQSVTVTYPNHPGYYPGAAHITVNLVYEKPSMRILGAQLAGGEGAALRTNIFAAAIEAGMTTKELGMSDMVYAPPFSNPWDVVHIACNAAH